MMTEEQAKTKWCPHSRVDSIENHTPNRGFIRNDRPETDSYPIAGSYCLASDCMWWDWDDHQDGYGECAAKK